MVASPTKTAGSSCFCCSAQFPAAISSPQTSRDRSLTGVLPAAADFIVSRKVATEVKRYVYLIKEWAPAPWRSGSDSRGIKGPGDADKIRGRMQLSLMRRDSEHGA